MHIELISRTFPDFDNHQADSKCIKFVQLQHLYYRCFTYIWNKTRSSTQIDTFHIPIEKCLFYVLLLLRFFDLFNKAGVFPSKIMYSLFKCKYLHKNVQLTLKVFPYFSLRKRIECNPTQINNLKFKTFLKLVLQKVLLTLWMNCNSHK